MLSPEVQTRSLQSRFALFWWTLDFHFGLLEEDIDPGFFYLDELSEPVLVERQRIYLFLFCQFRHAHSVL